MGRSSSRALVAAAALVIGASPAAAKEAAQAGTTAAPAVIGPGEGYVTLIRTQDGGADGKGRLLLSWEEPGRKGLPVYQSLDDGRAWTLLGRIVDTEHGGAPDWQVDWQPNLYQTPRATGPLPAGTVMFAANSAHVDARGETFEEDLQLYASQDGGKTWSYRGSIIQGHGRPPEADNHGVWEPNLRVLEDGRLVAYYSSEQHKAEGYNQLLAHKVSSDGGRTWGAETIDVAVPGGVERPGMAVVERLPDGRYVMSYEDIDGPRNNGQVYVKFSRDGLDWGEPSDRGTPVETQSGAYPAASPVVKWLPLGGPQGLLVVAAERGGGGGDVGGRDLYWNDDLGRGPWWRTPAPVQKATGNIHAGWTQGLLLDRQGALLHITTSSSAEAPERSAKNLVVSARTVLPLHRYEAEDGVRQGGAAVVPDRSASAAWKVRIPSAPLGRVRFDIAVHNAGPAVLTLRYAALGRPGRPEVSLDGARLSGPAEVQADGRWTLLRLPVTLRPGVAAVEVEAAPGPVDVDWIAIEPAA